MKGKSKKLEELLADLTERLAAEAKAPDPRRKTQDSLESRVLSLEFSEVSSLLETVRTISAVIQPKQPSEEFIARVSHAAQERLQEQISTAKIERIIGMAVTVEDFRKSLFHDIVAACRSIGFDLTPKELAALRNLKEDAVKEFANSLDERITKFFPANLP